MFRLGIIGSDNSHAEAFGVLANVGDSAGRRIPDVQVTHIYGTDEARTREVAERAKIPNIAVRSEDMLGNVDGVLCVWRHGSKHLKETLPFIKAGLPAFVDKPLASTVADARQLVSTAQQTKVGFTSFSTLRYCKPTVDWVASLPQTIDQPVVGVSTGPAQIDSEYDGLVFYGIHAVELMHAAFGYGVSSVHATQHYKNVTAVCKYAAGHSATLNFMYDGAYVFHVSAFGKKGHAHHTVDSGSSYFDGMTVIMDMMRTGKWPLTAEQLVEPIQVLEATTKSLAEGQEIRLSEV